MEQMSKDFCSYTDEDLIQIMKELNQIANHNNSSHEMYRVFAEHPDTLTILMNLLKKSESVELLSQVSIVLTNLSHDEMFSKKMFKRYEMLEEVNSLLVKYFLSNYFKEMSQKVCELLKDLIWLTNNLIQHENSYHQTNIALEVGLL